MAAPPIDLDRGAARGPARPEAIGSAFAEQNMSSRLTPRRGQGESSDGKTRPADGPGPRARPGMPQRENSAGTARTTSAARAFTASAKSIAA
jgi:hypothetical protein